jgi:hypothetical protein
MAWLWIFLAAWSAVGLAWLSSPKGRTEVAELYRRFGHPEHIVARKVRLVFLEYVLATCVFCGLAIYCAG